MKQNITHDSPGTLFTTYAVCYYRFNKGSLDGCLTLDQFCKKLHSGCSVTVGKVTFSKRPK